MIVGSIINTLQNKNKQQRQKNKKKNPTSAVTTKLGKILFISKLCHAP